MVLFHSGYNQGKECSNAVRGWLIIPPLASLVIKVTGVPGMISASVLTHTRVQGMLHNPTHYTKA